MDASAYFRGKKITLMGLGLLGRGVGDAKYLAECGAELIVTDLKSREELSESVTQLEEFPNITFVLGEHRLEDFRDRYLVIKAAGVPLDSPYIAEAKKHGIPVRMSADLFMELSGVRTIGVTGTRGKSTVAHMTHAILKEAGVPVVLGGNVRGISTLALLKDVAPGHTAVLELDSWQCQGLSEAKRSPHIAIFTSFYPDHMNYYGNDLGAYLADKANIFLYQREEDTLILGAQCAPRVIDTYGEQILAHVQVTDATKFPDTWTLRVPGAHNRYDAALALLAARAIGIEDEKSRAALMKFTGVPGRLELIGEKDGIAVYNDTTATTPEATLAALEALSADRQGSADRIILIMGGADKGLEMGQLLEKAAGVKRLILLAGTGTERIHGDLPGAPVYSSLEEAVADAFAHAVQGDAIVLSPAFASFGMFKNEYERGDRFNALVGTV